MALVEDFLDDGLGCCSVQVEHGHRITGRLQFNRYLDSPAGVGPSR
jgi:hypothetical protein